MRGLWLIARRELAHFVRTPSGYWIAAAVLLVDGLLFNSRALGSTPKLSAEVLQQFFFFTSGLVMIASALLSMRLFAEERQSSTLTLLYTAPIRERDLVLGKFLSALVVLTVITTMTAYMPALIFVNGKVSLGHIACGYIGLWLLGAASLALGVLGSALAKTQLVAGIFGGLFIALMLLTWPLAQLVDPPLSDVIAYFSLFDKQFRPFMRGIFQLSGVVFYLSVAYFALLAAVRVIESERAQ